MSPPRHAETCLSLSGTNSTRRRVFTVCQMSVRVATHLDPASATKTERTNLEFEGCFSSDVPM